MIGTEYTYSSRMLTMLSAIINRGQYGNGLISFKQYVLHILYLLKNLERQFPLDTDHLEAYIASFKTSFNITDDLLNSYYRFFTLLYLEKLGAQYTKLRSIDFQTIRDYLLGTINNEKIYRYVKILRSENKSENELSPRLTEYLSLINEMCSELYLQAKDIAYNELEYFTTLSIINEKLKQNGIYVEDSRQTETIQDHDLEKIIIQIQ